MVWLNKNDMNIKYIFSKTHVVFYFKFASILNNFSQYFYLALMSRLKLGIAFYFLVYDNYYFLLLYVLQLTYINILIVKL